MTSAQAIKQLVTFRIETEEFGLPITDVYEIIFVPQVTSIAKAPESIVGVINLRGEIIPVIDLRIQFLKEPIKSKKQRIIITRSQGRVIGLLVDEVKEVLRIDENSLEPVPDTIVTTQTAYMRAICKMDNRLIILLHLDHLLNKLEINFIINEVEKREENIP
ncbi:chemotaxis protein CheW [Paenibacillus naphthalenovorans]|uniref:chemotaxis protein CheW n=1 Tax=Paenibacillus naphthalenovorans TaxID=162209 RepID=UPI003D2C6562